MKKEDFLKESITDVRDTIRAIDRKIFGAIVILLLPITQLSNIVSPISSLFKTCPFLGYALVIFMILVWLIGLISCVLGLLSLDNPVNHVVVSSCSETYKPTGIFYGGSLYKVKFLTSLFPHNIKSQTDTKDYYNSFNLTEDELDEELAFEHMKLVFIRDLKIVRQKTSLISILIIVLIVSTLLIFDQLS